MLNVINLKLSQVLALLHVSQTRYISPKISDLLTQKTEKADQIIGAGYAVNHFALMSELKERFKERS